MPRLPQTNEQFLLSPTVKQTYYYYLWFVVDPMKRNETKFCINSLPMLIISFFYANYKFTNYLKHHRHDFRIEVCHSQKLHVFFSSRIYIYVIRLCGFIFRQTCCFVYRGRFYTKIVSI